MDRPKFDDRVLDGIDDTARQVAGSWQAGVLGEEDARRELLFLALGSPVLEQCVQQQAAEPTPHSRDDMRDRMTDLLEQKVLGAKGTDQALDLERLADDVSLCGWTRALLTGSGVYLRLRINRAAQRRLRQMARLTSASGAPSVLDGRDVSEQAVGVAWAAPQLGPEDEVLAAEGRAGGDREGFEPADGVDQLHAELLGDGTEVAARAAAFRALGSTFRGERRLSTQVALAAQMMQLDPPQHLPLSRLKARERIRKWCLANPDGARLRQLLSMLRTGQELPAMSRVEREVLAMFEGYTLGQAAALTSKPGYVLAHMALAAVEPLSPPPRKVVTQMVDRVSDLTGQASQSGRLVRRWAAAHGELTASEYSSRGVPAQVKTLEQDQADDDLFLAEVAKMLGDDVTALGSSASAVRAFLESLFEELMIAELDAQVQAWIGEPASSQVREPASES